jgi:hypothetical protein
LTPNLEKKDRYGSECQEKDGLIIIPLNIHLFQGFFYSLPLKCNEKPKPHVNDDLDEWQIKSEEMLNDGPQSLDQALLHAFTASIDPLVAFNKIKKVALLSTTVRRTKRAKRSKTYRQALLSAAWITGDAVSASSHKDECVPIVIESGDSVSVNPVRTAFLGPIRPCATVNLKGLSGRTKVIGKGAVNWLVRDMFGNNRDIRITADYVPEAYTRLFSTYTYFKKNKAGSLHITLNRMTLTLKDRSWLDFPYQESNLPLMLTDEHFNQKSLTVVLAFEDATVMATMDIFQEINQNITAPQRELMLWHKKWAHCDMDRVQTLPRLFGTHP